MLQDSLSMGVDMATEAGGSQSKVVKDVIVKDGLVEEAGEDSNRY